MAGLTAAEAAAEARRAADVATLAADIVNYAYRHGETTVDDLYAAVPVADASREAVELARSNGWLTEVGEPGVLQRGVES